MYAGGYNSCFVDIHAYARVMMISEVIKRDNQVVIAVVSHLFPFRTEKLSPLAPMVLQCNAGE